jgi:hypothetical protein
MRVLAKLYYMKNAELTKSIERLHRYSLWLSKVSLVEAMFHETVH